ncbi:hypothetical protein Tco_1006388 [Tanacetum coccineum]|uniref:Uncharacterized protein n=1 Tax=Tanacetum coccineum TaxID=301880 RepID=A0ABQ5FHM0_9ASTR
MFDGNTFVNPFATPSTSAIESSSSQYVDPSNIIADNVPNAMFDENTFVNPFATPSTCDADSPSSQYVDPSNMHMFYQPYPHEFQWTKDHPLEQGDAGEPSRPVFDKESTAIQWGHCMYAITAKPTEKHHKLVKRILSLSLRTDNMGLCNEGFCYQKKLNITKPDTYRSDLKRCEAYTTYPNPRGFIYQNRDKKNRLMRLDELYKFGDCTLVIMFGTALMTGFKDDKMLKSRRIMSEFGKVRGGNRTESDTQVFPMTMEILLEPTSNKLFVAGNPVKEILLKLNLPDHRSILTDSKEYIKMDLDVLKYMFQDFRYSDTVRPS